QAQITHINHTMQILWCVFVCALSRMDSHPLKDCQFMSVRGILGQFGMALAIFCLCIAFAPSQTITAESVCYVDGCPDGQPPVITQQPEDVTIPYEGTATFSVSAAGALDYLWYQGIPGDDRKLLAGGNSFTREPL